MEKKSTLLRKMYEEKKVVSAILVGEAHQAQLAQKAGFDFILVSGALTSATVFGLPDAGLITMSEMVENAERICQSVDVPVFVDCDTGFGNAINVRRTVESVIRVGAAGLFIEDQLAPKRCGFVKGKELISIEEAVGKYRAAIDVRDELDPDFVIMARTDGRGAVGGSLEEAIKRGKAYVEAGVDIIYMEALQSREEIKAAREAIPDVLMVATPFAVIPPLKDHEIEELGLCASVWPIGPVGAVAMYDVLVDLKERGSDAFIDWVVKNINHPLGGFGIFNLAGFPKVAEWEEKYLPKDTLDKYDQTIGIYDPRVSQEAHGE
jgi:2-methylisocitrate lyase-like PEP mutase family enzyme